MQRDHRGERRDPSCGTQARRWNSRADALLTEAIAASDDGGRMKTVIRLLVAGALAALTPLAAAEFHTFKIDRIYSNADGTVQYAVLVESAGFSEENFLGGHQITVTHNGVVKSFTFDHNLPLSSTSHMSVLIATQGFAALGIVTPDYVVPNGFFPTDGATVNYAFVDQMTYATLPTDGVTSLTRAGAIVANAATNFSGVTAAAPVTPVTTVEFYNAALDHYFISPLQPDIDALDSGRIAGWARTGQSFKVFPTAAAGGGSVNPVCRFLIPPEHGNSHFFSASPDECNAILGKIGVDPNYSGYIEETPSAFFVALPDTGTGACPAGTIPVYRLFNNRVDANHRYTTDPAIQAQMIMRGYIAEGYGPNATIMCAAQ